MSVKLALVCSHGGHLTELQFLSDAFDDHEIFYVSYDNVRTRELDEQAYLLESIDTNPWRMLKAFYRIGRILLKERPDAVVSTGSEIAIPAFVWARLLSIETVFIESWCRVQALSTTGKIVYPFSDLFLVQWPQLAENTDRDVRYKGAVL